MIVSELIEKLKAMPQDAEVYYASFEGFLDDNFKHTRCVITEKEQACVYNVDLEYKTVYHWSVRQQKHVPYTGVMLEVG